MSGITIEGELSYIQYCMIEFEHAHGKTPGWYYKMLQALLQGDLTLYKKIAKRRRRSVMKRNITWGQKNNRIMRRMRDAEGARYIRVR